MDSSQIETGASLSIEIAQIASPSTTLSPTSTFSPRISKDGIRRSLRASTVDGVFAAVFSIGTGGILLGNFLVGLDASPVVFGMVSSIPMLVNLFQPMGAYLSERSTSRFQYSLRTHGIGRLLWLILVIGIVSFSWGGLNSNQLVILSLLILVCSHLLGGLGAASWLSWIAMLVPRQLRGRYFGLRNSLAKLTELVGLPIAGLAVSHWYGGPIQGYGVILLLGIIFGIVSLGCQYFQVDINPQLKNTYYANSSQTSEIQSDSAPNEPSEISEPISLPQMPTPQNQIDSSIWKNSNFFVFLLYFGSWTFAVNLSAPFFNLYLLDTLNLDVSWVTFYNSLRAGAHMLMLIVWGRLADKIGNRPILISTGILIAVIPWLWLKMGSSPIDLWLWLPLLHIFIGANWGGVDLCNNNLQIEIAPVKNQSIYFATAAAVAGASGALGATIGGFIAQFAGSFGIAEVFIVSGVLRLASLVPLISKKDLGS
ncbi:MAG: MFS transporter [Nostoc sp. EfeVER01]|uniref:MFS transporter n=1 Tax=unclassified Nostoc TaxID=2593658 RepID=UPI002AD49173|nr:MULTISPECIES: MFS transporter [unclassified Nostoc]MDZ7946072.1 MFS transporter [Nostoc sp. EfeVER01]MDZ7995023.1 MFS transporter [Nostoc sp. EspVER01]